jgi:DNA polymerase IIIc chi subunit
MENGLDKDGAPLWQRRNLFFLPHLIKDHDHEPPPPRV